MIETKMCNNKNNVNSSSAKFTSNMKKKKKTSSTLISSTPFRRARTKIKKPKFLSLSHHTQLQVLSTHQKQLDLFPVHPDDQKAGDPDPDQDQDQPPENMADHMFAEEGPTLTGLLSGAVSSTTSSGLSYAVAEERVNSARSLVRTAMRRRREVSESEERWVSISEVVAPTVEVAEEEVTSGGGGGLWTLRLKLDYEEVLNAWSGSGKGPLYVEAEEEEDMPQTVPDLRYDKYGVVPLWGVGNINGQWSVPESSFNGQSSGSSQIGGNTGEEAWKLGLREASVLRYKEKRQNRLFAKRIRYEVRKLNAEKRPRIKGRFVKRCVG